MSKIAKPSPLIPFVLSTMVLMLGGSAVPSAMSTPVPDTIVFNPAVPTLNNPTTPGTVTNSSMLTVTLTAYDAHGDVLQPSSSNPLYVKVYGAPPGVISPTFVEMTSGNTATFNYSGKYFPNNLTVEAWIYDSLAGIPDGEPGGPVHGGYAMGVTQIAPQNRLECNFGNQSYGLNAIAGHVPPKQFVIDAAVGYIDPSHAARNYANYTVDTGSLGLIITLTDLPNRASRPGPRASAPVIGPGPRGTRLYTSDGRMFTGYYYLAPVTFKTSNGGTVQTIPLQVLGVNRSNVSEDLPIIHYLGIGFNRENPLPGDLFLSPGQNAFLNIKDSPGPNFITQGYVLSKHAPNITLGLTETVASRFSPHLATLTPNPNLPGEWNDMQGTFSFPDIQGAPEFSGNMFVDVGINEMFLDVDSSLRPPQAVVQSQIGYVVPQDTNMIVTGRNSDNAPVFTCEFSVPYESWPQSPPVPLPDGAPIYVKWGDPPLPGTVYINTGITPLTRFDYMYNSQCGEVGFADPQQ